MTPGQLEFDLAAAREARDEAIEIVGDNADNGWMDSARGVIHKLARDMDEFTTDDMWRLIEPPREPRAAGAAMQMAHRLGYCEPTDRTRISARPMCHARPVRIWRSKLRHP